MPSLPLLLPLLYEVVRQTPSTWQPDAYEVDCSRFVSDVLRALLLMVVPDLTSDDDAVAPDHGYDDVSVARAFSGHQMFESLDEIAVALAVSETLPVKVAGCNLTVQVPSHLLRVHLWT